MSQSVSTVNFADFNTAVAPLLNSSVRRAAILRACHDAHKKHFPRASSDWLVGTLSLFNTLDVHRRSFISADELLMLGVTMLSAPIMSHDRASLAVADWRREVDPTGIPKTPSPAVLYAFTLFLHAKMVSAFQEPRIGALQEMDAPVLNPDLPHQLMPLASSFVSLRQFRAFFYSLLDDPRNPATTDGSMTKEQVEERSGWGHTTFDEWSAHVSMVRQAWMASVGTMTDVWTQVLTTAAATMIPRDDVGSSSSVSGTPPSKVLLTSLFRCLTHECHDERLLVRHTKPRVAPCSSAFSSLLQCLSCFSSFPPSSFLSSLPSHVTFLNASN